MLTFIIGFIIIYILLAIMGTNVPIAKTLRFILIQIPYYILLFVAGILTKGPKKYFNELSEKAERMNAESSEKYNEAQYKYNMLKEEELTSPETVGRRELIPEKLNLSNLDTSRIALCYHYLKNKGYNLQVNKNRDGWLVGKSSKYLRSFSSLDDLEKYNTELTNKSHNN